MPKEYVLFREPREAESREAFSLDCEITEDNYAGLIGRVRLAADDRVACQIRKADRGLCRTKFGRGWVAVTKDGVEGYIGGDCANRHFDADAQYHVDSRQADLYFEIEGYVQTIRDSLGNRHDYLTSLDRLIVQADELHYHAQGLRDSLPPAVLKALEGRLKSGNRAVVLDYEYHEKEEVNGKVKTVSKWQPTTIGNLAALQFVDRATTSRPHKRLTKLREIAEEAKPDKSVDRKILKRWAKSLSEHSEIVESFEEAREADRRFRSEANLRLTMFLTRSHTDRQRIAQLIGKADEKDAREYVRDLEQGIRAQNKGLNFKVP